MIGLAVLAALAALGFEAAAVTLVLRGDASVDTFLSFLGAHAIASALFVLVCVPLLPERFRQPRLAVLGLCFSLSFFMPFFGVLALLVAVLVMRLLPETEPPAPFHLANTPEFLLSTPGVRRRFRELSVRQLLSDAALAPALRSPALNALSTMPVRVVGEMLQRLLVDPVEDMRLVAYGLLDNREKELRQRIDEQTAALVEHGDVASSPLVHALRLRAMVELHFELVYQRLVQGDLRDHALQQALNYAEQAIAHDAPNAQDPGLLQLRARVYLEQGQLGLANDDLLRAAEGGAPAVRVLPYLAEIAFLRRDWASVRAIMAQLEPTLVTPRVVALTRYWRTGKGRR